jgi:diguanylate cyclase (GGDEF)-like protein/PAS domain S-box-containing protein
MPSKAKKRIRKPSSVPPPLHIQPNEFFSFLNLSREITQTLDLDRALQNIVEKAPPFFRADGCILRLLNRKRNLLEAVKSFNVGDGFLKALNLDEGISGLATRGKGQVIVPNISKDPLFVFKEAAQREKFLSAICVPLQTKEKVMGTLTLLSRKPRRFGEKQAFLLRALANQAATATANAGAYEKIKKQVRQISFLLQDEKKAKNFLQNIIDHSLDPIVVTDIQGRITFSNRAAAEILGIAQDELLGREMADFYPGGREEVENIMKILLRREKLRNYETGLAFKGEKNRPVMLSASLLRDSHGQPEGTLGIFKDVPPYKQLLNQVTQTEKTYQKLFEAVNDAIVSVNRQGYFTTFNPMFLKLTGYTAPEIQNSHFSRILHPEDQPGMIADHQKVMRGESAPEKYTFRLLHKDGKVIYVEGNFRRLMENNGIVGVLGAVRDVTDRIQLEKELLALSITDGLTGLYNLRHFYTEMDKEMERARRQGTSLALLLFDLDAFKVYNDVHGHLEGDTVLKAVAEAVLRAIRKVDSAYRYGGDEFTVILPGAGEKEGVRVAERIKKSLGKFPGLQEISLSMGLVAFDLQFDLTVFIKKADEAMYTAKKLGGNQIFVEASKAADS